MAELSQAILENRGRIELAKTLTTKFRFKKPKYDNVDLSEAQFIGVDLVGAVFPPPRLVKYPDITYIDRTTTLINTSFADSFLNEVNLEGADLRGADFRGASLTNIHLEGADLRNAKLNGCAYIYGAHLEGAYMQYQDLGGMDLRGVHLQGAKLNGAILKRANLEGVNLDWADLRGASLEGSNFEGASMQGTLLHEIYLFCLDSLKSNPYMADRLFVELRPRSDIITYKELRKVRNESDIKRLLQKYNFSISIEDAAKLYEINSRGALRPYHIVSHYLFRNVLGGHRSVKNDCYDLLNEAGVNKREIRDRCCADPEGTITQYTEWLNPGTPSPQSTNSPPPRMFITRDSNTLDHRLSKSLADSIRAMDIVDTIFSLPVGEDASPFSNGMRGGRGKNKTKKRHVRRTK